MNATIIDIVYWAGLGGALAALIIYFAQIAIRPQWVRLISGAGLFFTGIGLAEAATLLRVLPSGAMLGGTMAVAALLAAVYFQGAASLRGRQGDRRQAT